MLNCRKEKQMLARIKKNPAEFTAIVLLLWALLPFNPYSYYTLMRFVVCGISIFLALKAHEKNKPQWQWIWIAIAVLYNPILRIHLGRDLWEVANVGAILVFAISAGARTNK